MFPYQYCVDQLGSIHKLGKMPVKDCGIQYMYFFSQKFLFYVLKSSDVLEVLVPILYHLNDSRSDQCKSAAFAVNALHCRARDCNQYDHKYHQRCSSCD